jgi:hypothetical protein
MIEIEYTIEVGWAHGSYTDTIEIDDKDLGGLEDAERAKAIDQIVGEAIANVVSWGWREVPK